jgi:hypothetical protein
LGIRRCGITLAADGQPLSHRKRGCGEGTERSLALFRSPEAAPATNPNRHAYTPPLPFPPRPAVSATALPARDDFLGHPKGVYVCFFT